MRSVMPAWTTDELARIHEGHVRSGAVEKDVAFAEVDDEALSDAIDEAYRSKYRRYQADVVDPMFAPSARTATLELVPR